LLSDAITSRYPVCSAQRVARTLVLRVYACRLDILPQEGFWLSPHQ
jgi:hypothetical protein